MSLQTKILILIIPLIVLPMIILGGVAYFRIQDNARTGLINQLTAASQQLEADFRSKIRVAEANIDLLSKSEVLKNYMVFSDEEQRYLIAQPPLLRQFGSYQQAYPEYYEIRILLPDGYEDARMTAGNVGNLTEYEQGSEIFKKVSASREEVAVTIAENPDNSSLSIYVSKRLSILDNEKSPVLEAAPFRGYLIFTVSLNDIKNRLDHAYAGRNGHIFLTDEHGKILLSNKPSQLNRVLPPTLFDRLLSLLPTHTTNRIAFDDGDYIFIGQSITPERFLFATLPEDELWAASRHMGTTVILITVIAVGIIVASVVMVLKSSVFARLEELRKAMDTVSTGKFDISLESSRNDEIGGILMDFLLMTHHLKEITVSRDYVDEILSSMTESLLVLSEVGTIVTANKVACEILKYNEMEFRKMNISDLFVAGLKVDLYAMGSNGCRNIETEVVTKDGKTIPVLLSCSVMSKAGQNERNVILLLRDVSDVKMAEKEKRDLEERLRRSEKMEAIGRLAGGVAHDLNNILSGIVGYPELLLMNLPASSSLREPLKMIMNSGLKAAAIVQDLLILSRRGVEIREVVDLRRIVDGYLESPEAFRMKSDQENVTVETKFDENLMNIEGSPIHLEKTVMNLLLNAYEACLNKGRIVVRLCNQYIDTSYKGHIDIPEGEYVVMSIEDTGIGISDEDMEHIFEPFYTKKVMGRSGTGLGMSLVWGTVKDHKGYIDIKSTEGKGTTVTIYFPGTRRERTEAREPMNIEELRGLGEIIMVVDDVPEQREIASKMLEQLGYEAVTASSGEEAVVYLKEHPVDLMVLDMIMDPGMDGLETYRRVLQESPRQKAVIASGFSETERVVLAQELGAGAYIRKPYSLIDLGVAVKGELEVGRSE